MGHCSCSTIDDTVYVSTTRGDTVSLDVALYDVNQVPLNVSGWLWLAQVRDSADVVVTTFDVTDVEPGIGQITLSIEPGVTETMLGDYDWDLEATDLDADVRTLVHGRLRIREDVSR